MSQTFTISASQLMLAVPGLIALGGVVVGVALHGHLTTGIEVARLNADNDARTARWLWQRGYRSTPHAGPDITDDLPAIEAEPHVDGEVLHVEHPTSEIVRPTLPDLAEEVALVQALSDRPTEDEDEVGEEQPGEATSQAPARLWQRFREWLTALLTDVRDLFKGDERRAAEFWAEPEAPADPTPELEAPVEVAPEPVEIVRRRYRDPGMTGQYPLVKVVGDKAAGRHRAEVVIPEQRTGGDDL